MASKTRARIRTRGQDGCQAAPIGCLGTGRGLNTPCTNQQALASTRGLPLQPASMRAVNWSLAGAGRSWGGEEPPSSTAKPKVGLTPTLLLPTSSPPYTAQRKHSGGYYGPQPRTAERRRCCSPRIAHGVKKHGLDATSASSTRRLRIICLLSGGISGPE